MKVKFINSWKSKLKQTDKLEVIVRTSKVTLFALVGDWSRREIFVTLLNFKLDFKF